MTEGILFYQATILVIVIVAARFGESALNKAAMALVFFTFSHVFMPWLMVLQFGTIYIGYRVGKKVAWHRADSEGSSSDDGTTNSVATSKSEETSENDLVDLCGNALAGVSESAGGYGKAGGNEMNQAADRQDEDGGKIFHSFQEASAYAKRNPGLRIKSAGGRRYVVRK